MTTTLIKGKFTTDEYVTLANWCNENGKMLVEYDDRYEAEDAPIFEPTYEEKKRDELFTLKSYLSSTDYIDNKIIEASILGGASEIIAEYRPILLKRADARKRINELENTEEV